MKPLTREHSIEHNFTAIDLVKHFRPNWTDEDCDLYLWENTSYPFDMDRVIEQLNKQLIEPEQHTVVGC